MCIINNKRNPTYFVFSHTISSLTKTEEIIPIPKQSKTKKYARKKLMYKKKERKKETKRKTARINQIKKNIYKK